MLAVRSVFPPARGGGSRRMKKKRKKKGDASTALAFPSASAGPRVSESHGKERIRRKVIRRDGTGRYRGPRIKLGYLRNLMPHEPVFGTGEDPRGSLSLSSPLLCSVGTIFLPPLSASNPPGPRSRSREIHRRGSIRAIDREWRKRIVRVPRLESRTCLIERKRKEKRREGKRREEGKKEERDAWVGNDTTANRGEGVD